MKKFCFIIVLLLCSLLCSCGVLVDTNTPKSAELSEKYDFYEKSVNTIRNGCSVTPEEADEIFLVLVNDCGVTSVINNVTRNNDGTFSIWSSGTKYTVVLVDNMVSTVFTRDFLTDVQLYPASTEEVYTTEEMQVQEETSDDTEENTEIVAKDLNGRGYSDSGRSEPQYENISGYVAVYGSYSLEQNDAFVETPWTIPIYEKDKQFWVECGVVDHKTEVTVISQQLEHDGYDVYSGYLLVERLDNNEQFYISVKNFITKPYWTYDDLEMATSVGCCIAEFNQVSDYYPVTKSNDKVELDNGVKVLIVGRTGLYGRGGPDRNTNSIEAVVFKEWKNGYGGVSVFFNQEDLTIIY